MSKTVAKALGALQLVREGPLSLSALADRMGVHASTALRMLEPMLAAGLLARGTDGRYRLGLELAALGQEVLEGLDVRAAAHPHLVELARRTGATAHLAQLLDDAVVYVDKVESPDGFRLWSRVGRPVPLHTAAASKAILAGLAPARREALLAGWEFTRHTEQTLGDVAALEDELAVVAARGWARDAAEFEPLVQCVGVPLTGTPDPAALSLTAVREPPTDHEVADLVTALRATATAIARDLGRPGPTPPEPHPTTGAP